MPSTKSFEITLGDINFLLEQLSHTILVVRYDGAGRPIYGYRDASTATGYVELGTFGTFDPLSVNGPDGLPLYQGARDAAGFRILEGFFNNLTGTTASPGAWMWGSVDEPFPRLTAAQYNHYVHQVLENAALTNPDFVAYLASHPNLPEPQADSTALYADPSKSVVDYTPRMITQTISSSYMDHASSVADSALARTGLETDTFTETVTYADGTTAQVHETVIRNQNTLPGDPSTSGIFTLFGQFFDHGLDFIDKGGQGSKIVIALDPSDPLYRAPHTIGASDPGNLTITISRATPDGYTFQDIHGRAVSIAGADGAWNTGDELANLAALGSDGVAGTADDVKTTIAQPTGPATYTNHTSPYIDQSQSYGSDEQITTLLRQWVRDPNTGAWKPGAELFDGHQTQVYSSTTFNELGMGADGRGLTTRTVPTLDELRAHVIATGRDALTWDDINNYRERDASGHVIDTNGAAAGGYVCTGQALLLDMNPDFTLINYSNATIAAGGITAANIFGFIDFSNFSIRNMVAGNPVTGAQYAAVSEALMEAVGKHYIAGDGRVNENFGLTSLHHVFHENHNVQLVNLENNILAQADPAVRHSYQELVHFTVTPTGTALHVGNHYEDAAGNYTTSNGTISWDQDKMFAVTKLINEMEYQHVAIDQYARLVTPDLPEFVTYDSNINADISLEYSQAAFRFGHSQLRETIDAIDPNGMVTKFALSGAFLNPAQFAAVGASDILRGMSQQVSNEVDEFLTPAMQQSLLGQALDLGAINIARGRDAGLPTLNETRRALHDALVAERAADPTTPHHTNLIVDALNPYTSWNDFGSQMLHPESLVNFIAAYAFDGDLAKAEAIAGLEAGTIAEGSAEAQGFTFDQAVNFLNNSLAASDPLAAGADAFNAIDLWIGGLAEVHVFTGQLGTTFNAIFEDQMERLMDGDRFYYLYRLMDALPIDTDLGHAIATEQFRDIIERTTGVQHLNGDVMGYADSYIELGKTLTPGQKLLAYKGELIHDASGAEVTANQGDIKYQLVGGSWVPILADYKTAHNYGQLVADYAAAHPGAEIGIYSGPGGGTVGNGGFITKSNADLGIVNQLYIRDFRPNLGANDDGTDNQGFDAHEVLSGTDYRDYIQAGNGDDTVYGDKGDDVLDGQGGADHLYGGDGQDVLYGGDIEDFVDGGAGDDIVYAGTSAGALDVVIGGDGNDKMYGEAGIDEMYGGAGDDYMDAGGDTDLVFGDGGNDILLGGDGPDELRGGLGDDMISGGSGADVLKGEGGDDILFGGIGQNAANGDGDELLGDVGFDLAAFSDVNIALDVPADLRNANLVFAGGTPFNPFGQLFADLEGIVGSKFDDKLIGDDNANWLVGGGGNDTFNTTVANTDGTTGSGGNDVIIGDKIRLDTLIGAYAGYTRGLDANGNATHGVTGPLSGGLLGNAALGTGMFDKHFTDLLKSEANKDFALGGDSGVAGTNDLAVFTGKRADYTVTAISYVSGTADGTITAYKITDNGGLNPDGSVRAPSDGTDLLIGVEKASFNGVVYSVDQLVNHTPTGSVGFDGGDRTVSGAQVATLTPISAIFDADNITAANPLGAITIPSAGYNWQTSLNGTTWTTIPTGNGANQQSASHVLSYGTTAAAGVLVHLTAGYTDSAGTAESVVSPTWNLIVGSGATGTPGNNTLNGADKPDGAGGTFGDVIFGLNGNDTLNGGLGNDYLFGGAGTDGLNGGDGNDYLNGGAGTNTLRGGAGNDTYVVNSGSDTVDEVAAGSSGIDTVLSSITYTLGANVENLTLTGNNINGTGNGLDNVITGSSGNNTLDGGSVGNDTLIGGLGNDLYIVSHAGVMVSENPSGGTDTVSTTLTAYTLDANVENLTYTGTAAFTGTGNGLDNVITGGSLADTLKGLAGNDTLIGGLGADTLDGGDNNDIFKASAPTIGNDGNDFYIGGAGTDTYDLSAIAANATVNLSVGTATSTQTGSDVLSQIENVIGGSGNDVIVGDANSNVIQGGTGRDTLTGGLGLSADTFVFKSAAEAGNGTGTGNGNADLITDFQPGIDKIDVSAIDADTRFLLGLGQQHFIWNDTVETGTQRPQAGHMGYHYEGSGINEVTVVDANINTVLFGTDTTVDFQIKLAGHLTLHAADFLV